MNQVLEHLLTNKDNKLMANQTYIETAKEVAGKAIGKHGLIYNTIIVAMKTI